MKQIPNTVSGHAHYLQIFTVLLSLCYFCGGVRGGERLICNCIHVVHAEILSPEERELCKPSRSASVPRLHFPLPNSKRTPIHIV